MTKEPTSYTLNFLDEPDGPLFTQKEVVKDSLGITTNISVNWELVDHFWFSGDFLEFALKDGSTQRTGFVWDDKNSNGLAD